MATLAVRILPLVQVGDPALLELGLAVAAVLAVPLSVVHGDGERVLEGGAATLHVEVEHLVEVAVAVVECGHVGEANRSLSAHRVRVLRHLHRLDLWLLVPDVLLPLAPLPKRVRESDRPAGGAVQAMPPEEDIRGNLGEPRVHPGHLVATLEHREQELHMLGLAALVFEADRVGMSRIKAGFLCAPVGLDNPLPVRELHVFKLLRHVLLPVQEVVLDVAAEVIASHAPTTEAALPLEVAVLLLPRFGEVGGVLITRAQL